VLFSVISGLSGIINNFDWSLYMRKTSEIRIRDPFIVTEKGIYYLYGTSDNWETERNLYVYKSTDMENWSDPTPIFTIPDDSWAVGELWAPEVHRYNGKFYLFVSILGKSGLRGVQIAVSETLDGMFECIVNHPATPSYHCCIDGTLYVEDGTPYIVYSHDWPDNYVAEAGAFVGQIAAVELTPDLCEMVGEPFLLFNSNEAPISAGRPTRHTRDGVRMYRYGSDAPFVMKNDDGSLTLLWSPIPESTYIVASAVSKSGKIKGEWVHQTEAVFGNNGGHPMIFEDFDGQKKMCMHFPEKPPMERALILDVEVENGIVKIK
jgi:hypothetical protein